MAKAKNELQKVGYFSFIGGILLAIIFGLILAIPKLRIKVGADTEIWLHSLLILLGLVVGFFNISIHERKEYLFTALILVLVTKFGGLDILGDVAKVGPYLTGVLTSFLMFVVPAVLVVCLKHILSLSKD